MPRLVGGRYRQYCSVKCANVATNRPDDLDDLQAAIRERYPTEGPDKIAKEFGRAENTIRKHACQLNVHLSATVYQRRVHGAARQHMLEHNPMKRPEVVAKVQAWQQEHKEQVLWNAARAKSHNLRDQPSGLERQLHEILSDLSVSYKSQVPVKPKFIVDVKIGNLIIQADGDYWHGHPRFEPLTDRQLAQQRRDKAQDKYLTTCGYSVVRIWESDMSPELVQQILKEQGILLGQ